MTMPNLADDMRVKFDCEWARQRLTASDKVQAKAMSLGEMSELE